MKRLLLITVLFSCIQSIEARDSGSSSFRFGYFPKMVFFEVNDPDGKTDSASDFQYIGALITLKLERDTRLMSYIALYDFNLDAGFNQVGQSVETTSFAAYYQSQFKLGRSFKPWLGVGGVINIDEFTNRVDTDQDGFLRNTFKNRNETVPGIGLIASQEWELNDSISLGLNVEYLIPIGDTLEGLSVGLSVIYD